MSISSILILDLSFNPYFAGSYSGSYNPYLSQVSSRLSFNPYFAGSYSGSLLTRQLLHEVQSFNPYFAGSYSGSNNIRQPLNRCKFVSILILLEVILEAYMEEL